MPKLSQVCERKSTTLSWLVVWSSYSRVMWGLWRQQRTLVPQRVRGRSRHGGPCSDGSGEGLQACLTSISFFTAMFIILFLCRNLCVSDNLACQACVIMVFLSQIENIPDQGQREVVGYFQLLMPKMDRDTAFFLSCMRVKLRGYTRVWSNGIKANLILFWHQAFTSFC